MSARQERRFLREVGTPGSFSDSGGDERGGIELDAFTQGQAGNIRIQGQVRIPSTLPGPEFFSNDLEIRVAPSGITDLKNRVNRLAGRLSNQFNMSRSYLSSVIQPDFPSPSAFEFSQTIPAGSQPPVNYNFNVPDFEPVRVPDVEAAKDFIPNVRITVSVVPTGFFGVGGGLFSEGPSVELELPPEAFVIFVDTDEFGCEDMFSNIQSRLDRLRQRIPEPGELQSELSDLESIRDEVVSRSNVGSLRSVTPSSLSSLGENRIQQLRDRVRQIDPDPVAGFEDLGDLQNLADDIRGELSNISPNCRSNFQSMLNNLVSQLDRVQDLANRIQSLRDQLLDNIPTVGQLGSIPCAQRSFGGVRGSSIDSRLNTLENTDPRNISVSDVDRIISNLQSISSSEAGPCVQEFLSRARALRSRPRQQVSDIGCGDVSRFVKNAVSGAESEVQGFSDSRLVSRTPARFNSVISTIQGAREQVESSVDDQNPCKDQLLGRLDAAESALQSARPESEEALSCEGRFSSIDDRLTSLEEDALSVEPPVPVQQFELFTSRADNLINEIENEIPEGDRCRRQFIRRADGVVNRVGRIGSRVRIETELTNQQIQQRQEVIDQLKTRLEEVRGRERGGGVLSSI